MKRKAISILVAGLVMVSFAGCGTQAETANSAVPGQSLNETAVVDNNASADVEENTVTESTNEEFNNINMEADTSDINTYTDIVFYNEPQGESIGKIDINSLVILEPAVARELIADTDIYNAEGCLVGYITAKTTIDFNLMGTEWIGFSFNEDDSLFMRVEDAEKNIEYEDDNDSEVASGLTEDVTDGNITLYGGEKYPQKYASLGEGISEELNIVFTNEDEEILLYSGEGRLCGHINHGGTILINGHCDPATAWYRIENPIEGTEYDYLYVLIYETKTAEDNKGYLISFIESEGEVKLEPNKILDTPEADMECYEFSMPRERCTGIGVGTISHYLYSEELDIYEYNTFCVECVRNGDNYDCKVYYK